MAAVSNAGGLGVLGVGFAPEPFIRDQITATWSLTTKPFGLNVIMIPPNLEHVTRIVQEEKPPVMYADTIAGLEPLYKQQKFALTNPRNHGTFSLRG